VDRKLAEWLPVIGEVMSVPFPETSLTKFLDAKIKKQRVFDIVFDFMKYIARSKPVNIIIEDVHWADTASMELVNYIGRNIEDKAILLTLVHRPLKKKEEFMEKEFCTPIALKELTREDSLELVKNLLNIKDIAKGFRDLIIEKSQGNPFYIEELVKSLIEQGYVVEEKGTWKFTGDVKKLQLPDTVEAVILSRIDRLDLQERDVLQVASVLGREFDDFLISGIYPDAELLKRSLRNLQRLDLIRQEKGEKQLRYFFKHIMTREVAYGTLSFARKQDLHRQTGVYIEGELKERKEEFLGLLSYHFYAGGDFDKSLLYSVEAGEKAKRVYANEEAIEFFTRAIDSYEKLEKEGKVDQGTASPAARKK
jgi:adenylate cyclase